MEKATRVRPVSLARRLFLYVLLGLALAQLLSLAGYYVIDRALVSAVSPAPDAVLFSGRNVVYISHEEGAGDFAMPEIADAGLFAALQGLRPLVPIVVFSLVMAATVLLFYRRNMKGPLAALSGGMAQIARQNLSQPIQAQGTNELWRLCGAFDDMRLALRAAFERQWAAEENQRNLYRAFAHDLRTPLAIIKGNQEIVADIAGGSKSWAHALAAADASLLAVGRMERYLEEIRRMASLLEIEPERAAVPLGQLAGTLRQQYGAMDGGRGVAVSVQCDADAMAQIDQALLLRVLDNLVDNALRYARANVRITIAVGDEQAAFTVADDGPGFTGEALRIGLRPFYSTEKEHGHSHMGMGLAIAQQLLAAQGSTLSLANGAEGGGCARFSLPTGKSQAV